MLRVSIGCSESHSNKSPFSSENSSSNVTHEALNINPLTVHMLPSNIAFQFPFSSSSSNVSDEIDQPIFLIDPDDSSATTDVEPKHKKANTHTDAKKLLNRFSILFI